MTDMAFSGDLVLDTYVLDSDITDYATISTKRLAIAPRGAIDRGRPVPDVLVDLSRNDLLTDFGKATMDDRYIVPGEDYQDRFANCVRYYANDSAHAQRMYDYVSKLYCMPSTPILSNGGTLKGNLISCYVNEVPDSMQGIIDIWTENAHIGSKGGGLGTYWSNVRGIGEGIKLNGKTSGAMSFMHVMDSMVACIDQGSNRRGAGACYLRVDHPEIDSFLDMRRQAGGDPDRKNLNLHHGIVVTDTFMHAAEHDLPFELISPHTNQVVETINARDLMIKILLTRLETGEPYILFEQSIHKSTPEHHKRSNLHPKTSNLCTEITLPTGLDHHNQMRTAICCLFQINLEKWDEWKDDPFFIKDIMYFLDNVLEDFIVHAGTAFMTAQYSALRERSIGVGVMGFHSFLQARGIPYESVMANVWNTKLFTHIKEHLDRGSVEIAEERGPCPDAAEHGIMERFSYKSAIAPTATSSVICGGRSAGTDMIPANVYTHKTMGGAFDVRNPHLQALLVEKDQNTESVWKSIGKKKGSVQHLDFLSDDEKELYKTSFEIDQRYHIMLYAERTPLIDQAQSLNIALPSDCHKRDLWKLHKMAWENGIKSMYYLRSYSIADADTTDGGNESTINYDVCLSCQ